MDEKNKIDQEMHPIIEIPPAREIRVLVVTNAYPTDKSPGNPSIKEQVSALRKLGVNIDLLIIKTGNKASYLKAAYSLFLLSFQKKRFDIIHAYYGLCGLLARLQFKYPLIVTFLGSDLLGVKGKKQKASRDSVIGRIIARLADVIIVMTQEMKCITHREDAYVIPFGIDLDLFQPFPKEQARLELRIPLSKKLILFPWRPERAEKRFDIVQGAFQILEKQFEDLRVVTISNESHERVVKYMCACDVMVLASDHEGSPVTIREAIACGLPIVSVAVGDIAETIAGIDGCYLCERNPKDMADKIGLVLKRGQRIFGYHKIRTITGDWTAEQIYRVYERFI